MDKNELIAKLNVAENSLSKAINELESVISDVEEYIYNNMSESDKEILMDGLSWNMDRLKDSGKDIEKDIKYYLNK